jgi:hypothetical protein
MAEEIWKKPVNVSSAWSDLVHAPCKIPIFQVDIILIAFLPKAVEEVVYTLLILALLLASVSIMNTNTPVLDRH